MGTKFLELRDLKPLFTRGYGISLVRTVLELSPKCFRNNDLQRWNYWNLVGT